MREFVAIYLAAVQRPRPPARVIIVFYGALQLHILMIYDKQGSNDP